MHEHMRDLHMVSKGEEQHSSSAAGDISVSLVCTVRYVVWYIYIEANFVLFVDYFI